MPRLNLKTQILFYGGKIGQRIGTMESLLLRDLQFTVFLQKELCMHAKSLQSCQTLRDPTDFNLPGSSVHGILQARILEWVAMPSSRGSS